MHKVNGTNKQNMNTESGIILMQKQNIMNKIFYHLA